MRSKQSLHRAICGVADADESCPTYDAERAYDEAGAPVARLFLEDVYPLVMAGGVELPNPVKGNDALRL